jgi:serine/threonine protein kinase
VLHRDIKPANILITNEKEIRICDFGLSRTYDPYSDMITSNPTRKVDGGILNKTPSYNKNYIKSENGSMAIKSTI